ncbi:MAG TPA: acyl carrier protein [Acidobacteriota bacterium]|jgi:D-alanine--poly(phosphoribitol) ligase subunit 2
MFDNGIQQQVQRILVEQLNLHLPSPDTDLIGSGFLDSLGFVELLLQLEQRFGIQIRIEALELDDLKSVAKIAEFVAKREKGRSLPTGETAYRVK